MIMIYPGESDEAKGVWGVAGDMIAPLSEPLARLQTDERPTVLIINDAGQAKAMAGWGERAGLRCLGSITPEAVGERLARTAALDFILLDLRGVDVAARIGRATAHALTRRYGLADVRLAVITDLAGLDCALALLDSPETEFLCDPSECEIITLLVMAGLRQARSGHMLLHDAAQDSETARLERLSEEVRRLAATIERMTVNGFSPLTNDIVLREAGPNGVVPNGVVKDARGVYRSAVVDMALDPAQQFQPRERPRSAEADGLAAPTHAEIRAIIRARRLRDQFLPADLFADPAWDMMLDLLAAKLSGQRVSVSSLCIAAAVPPTTALRWIRQLTDRAVFARIDDPADGRRVFIELTEAATQAVLSWAGTVRRNGGLLAMSGR